jgi:K+ transporter
MHADQITVAILVALFAVQRFGTDKVGYFAVLDELVPSI